MNTNEKSLYFDPDIPLEQQIVFLRQSSISFQLNTFQVLKEKLGDEGIEIFKTILRVGTRQGIDGIKGKSFQELKKMAGVPDRILGLHVKQNETGTDELQYTITHCPYLEESKRRGMEIDFCNILEEVQIEEINKDLAEITEPERMCWGDDKCTVKMRNIFGL